MKLMSKAVICGLAAVAVATAGCSSNPSTGGSKGSVGPSNGEIGLNLTLANGSTITALNYSLTNAVTADDLTGTITLPTGTATFPFSLPTTEIVPVVPATGYTLTVTGTSSDMSVTCTGSAGPFSVTAGNETVETIVVTCTSVGTSGSVEANIIAQACPTVQTLTAINSTANTTAPGNTSNIFAAAAGPNQAGVTYVFSASAGTLSGQVNAAGGVSSSTVFTCPATPLTAAITVTTTDQAVPTRFCSDQSSAGNATCALSTSTTSTACGTGGTCVQVTCPPAIATAVTHVTCGTPAAACTGVGTGVEASPNSATGTCPAGQSNTGTLEDTSGNFCCSLSAPCAGVGSGTEATPDTAAGTCPANQTNSVKDANGNFCCAALGPCTTVGQTNCVSCSQNANGVCTPTEADFIALDIKNGLATAAGPAPAASCYSCLATNGCLDSSAFSGNECEDTTGAAAFISGTTATQCEAVVQCILGSGTGASQCATQNPGVCYCGAGVANSTCAGGSSATPDVCSTTAGPIKGVCAPQIAAGLGFPCGDGADIAPNTNTTNLAAGRADQIFTCANSNSCTQCL
jgi:hypothetical protein